MTISGIRTLISRGYDNSVLRRSVLLLSLMGPAFAINFALYYAAAALLPAEGFGLFYIAVTTANVLYSGSFVLNIFFTRHLVSVVHTDGPSEAYAVRARIQGMMLRWGALTAAAAMLVLSLLGKWIGIQSLAIVVLIVLDAYSAYIIDIDRAFLQSLRKTLSLGGISLIWMALRFGLAVTGMALFGTTSGGLLGVVLAAGFVLILFSFLISSAKSASPRDLPALPSIRKLVPVIFGYVSLIVVSNLDVLLTYLLLKDDALGAYSASSVFPKGILVVVTPLLQMLYPMMVGRDDAPRDIRRVFQKSVVVILALSGAIAVGVFGFSGLLCGGKWGLKLCQPVPLELLLISAVTLSVLRALVLYQSARGRDWTALSMIVPAAVYFWIAQESERNVVTVAQEFTVFSLVLLLLYGGVTLLTGTRPRRGMWKAAA
jgi:O-antigen/teichoic acid export membrane protein